MKSKDLLELTITYVSDLWEEVNPKLESHASLAGHSSINVLGTALWVMPVSFMPFHGPLLCCCYCPHAAFCGSAHNKVWEPQGCPVLHASKTNTLDLIEMITHDSICKVISRSTGTQMVVIIIVVMFMFILCYLLSRRYLPYMTQVLWKLAMVEKLYIQ